MPISVVFHCNYLAANVGVPGVYQALVADLRKHGGEDIRVYGSDYKRYYRFEWADDGSGIDRTEVSEEEIENVQVVVFSAFDPHRRMFSQALKWRRRGSRVGFWCWGYHTKQQSQGNWEKGGTPRWVKRLAIFAKRRTMAPLVDFYLVSGDAEIIDSRLDPQLCIQLPMGRPQSAILDECDRTDPAEDLYGREAVSYIGRGCWETKGVGNIVEYSKTARGKGWLFRFFISSKEDGFDERVAGSGAANLEWHEDVFGKDNLPWLRRSAAFITINPNPAQIRTPYEALYAGTPIVMNRGGFMDGFKGLLSSRGVGGAVTILGDGMQQELDFEIPVMEAAERIELARVMRVTLDSSRFGGWLGGWLLDPQTPASYFDFIASTLKAEDEMADR